MKYLSIGGVLLLTALAQSSWSAAPEKTQADAKALNGSWAPSSAVMGGKAYTEEEVKKIHLALHDGKYTAKVGDEVDKGTFTIDDSKEPKTLTITGTEGPNKGKTIPAIYELEKNKLKVCYDMSGKAAPEKFESTAESKLFLVTYERKATTGKKRARRVIE